MKRHPLVIKILTWHASLSKRERMIVAAVGIMCAVYVVVTPLLSLQEAREHNENLIAARENDLMQVNNVLKRYYSLVKRRDSLQEQFDKLQLSFEQVTNVIDTIVKESIGSDDYELKKTSNPSELGLEYEKQGFSLVVKKLSLDQLVQLMHKLEYGKTPLIVGGVDISKPSRSSSLRATLQVYSIRKKQA
jgi:predicted nuclease with TOPRIM domain